MSLLCNCPAPVALTTIPAVTCPESFGQIQKVAFQRLYIDGEKNKISDASIVTKATWTALLASEDENKIVISPYINNPTSGGGDARMSSGGNDDISGIPSVLGENPVTFEGQFRGVPQSTIAIIKELMCEAKVGNLGVYLFDGNGRIQCIADGDDCYPIPIKTLFVGSKIHGNYDAKDSNAVSWKYAEGYSDKLAIITPTEFNPVIDLIPA